MANQAPGQGPRVGPAQGRPDPEVAKVVYLVGKELKVSDKIMLSSFEAALVESGMENLNFGDLDSLGVFQQRPSQGWGTGKEVSNVNYAARQFFARAEEAERENPDLTAGQIAQEVQVSAYPGRYDQQENRARRLLRETKHAVGDDPPLDPAPAPPNESFARAEGYIFEAMMQNAQSREVTHLRELLKNPPSWNDDDHPYHQLSEKVAKGGDWDYASILPVFFPMESRVFFEGKNSKQLFYDYYVIWSNLHLGYVGGVAGFNPVTLLPGEPLYTATVADKLSEKTYGEDHLRGDVIAVSAGYTLYQNWGLNLSQYLVHQAVVEVAQKSRGLTAQQSEMHFLRAEYYIHDEMLENIESPLVGELRDLLRPVEWWEVWRHGDSLLAKGKWAAAVAPHAPWDHKPILQAKFGLESGNDFYFKILEDRLNRAISYDIWSNIHFGYVGRAAGFDRQTLIEGANSTEAGESDPGDDISMHLGVTLWEKHGERLTLEDLHNEVIPAINEIGSPLVNSTQVRHWRPEPS